MPYKWTNVILFTKLMSRLGLRMPELGAPSPTLSDTIVPVVSIDQLAETPTIAASINQNWNHSVTTWQTMWTVTAGKRWRIKSVVLLADAGTPIDKLGYVDSTASAEPIVLKSQTKAIRLDWTAESELILPAGTLIQFYTSDGQNTSTNKKTIHYDEIDIAGV